MRSKLYVETSVISYLTARPSRDVIALAHQELTREWWGPAQAEFELFASRCKHIANARMLRFVTETCRSAGFEPPVICTPEELAED